MRDWTPTIIAIIPFALAALDVLLYKCGGNEATISVAMLRARLTNPLVAVSTTFTAGVFTGHCFYAKFTAISPPTYEVIARLCVVMSPTIYALIVIWANNGANEVHRKWVESNGHWTLMGLSTLAFIVGQLAGMFLLPQHVAPVVTLTAGS